jgi:hypothetical protein
MTSGSTTTIDPPLLHSILSQIQPPAVDVEWASWNQSMSLELGFTVVINNSNAHMVAAGLERGLKRGGNVRHGKGTCVWGSGVKYEGDLMMMLMMMMMTIRLFVLMMTPAPRRMAVRLHAGLGSPLPVG